MAKHDLILTSKSQLYIFLKQVKSSACFFFFFFFVLFGSVLSLSVILTDFNNLLN